MAVNSVRMTLKWHVPAGESAAITAILQRQIMSTRAQRGCARCSLSTAASSRVVVTYTEEWHHEDDLKREIRSPRFAVLTELIEHASRQPTIEFALPGSTRGLDYAREVCRH
jgi:quinol monooxygenase YgiN